MPRGGIALPLSGGVGLLLTRLGGAFPLSGGVAGGSGVPRGGESRCH